MKLAEFKCDHRRPDGTHVIWKWRKKVETAAGKFELAFVFPIDDMTPPGEEMFRAAEELIAATNTNLELIGDILHADYKAAMKNDEGWVGDFMPLNVPRQEIWKYAGDPTLDVTLNEPYPGGKDAYERRGGIQQSINFDPDWDSEHGVHLRIEKGKITRVNGSKFQIKKGFLRLADD